MDVPTLISNPDLSSQITRLNDLLGQLVQFTSHVGTGAMTAHVIQWLKTRVAVAPTWQRLSDRAKVMLGLLAAALPAAGISIAFQHPTADAWTIGITGLTGVSVGKLVWSLAQNWVFQQGWYQSVIKPKPVTGVSPTGTGSGASDSPTPIPVTPVRS